MQEVGQSRLSVTQVPSNSNFADHRLSSTQNRLPQLFIPSKKIQCNGLVAGLVFYLLFMTTINFLII